MKKLRVVQIGLGHDHATMIFDSLLSMPDIFEVAAFAVPQCEEKEFADKIAVYENQRKIPRCTPEEALAIPGLDGAVIETEEKNLTKYAIMAAEKNLHIHIDKPGGMDLSEFTYLVELLKKKNLVFSTGYMYRFNPFIREAFDKIKRGELGEIYSVEAHMNCDHAPEKRKWLAQFPGGMMFYLGCHLVDLVYSIMGAPEEVIPCNASILNDGAEDFGMAVFKYKNGTSFVKTCAAEPGGFMRRQLVICGEKGTIEIYPLEIFGGENSVGRLDVSTKMRYVKTLSDDSGFNSNWSDAGEGKTSEMFNRYDSMMIKFAQMIRGERENEYSHDYELEMYKLVLRACGEKM